jgi:hypothetical protein
MEEFNLNLGKLNYQMYRILNKTEKNPIPKWDELSDDTKQRWKKQTEIVSNYIVKTLEMNQAKNQSDSIFRDVEKLNQDE